MNKIAIGIISGTAGAAVGGVVAWKLLDLRYSKIIQEEIDSVRDLLVQNNILSSNGVEEESECNDTDSETIVHEDVVVKNEKPELMTYYKECAEKYNATTPADTKKEKKKKKEKKSIYPIDYENFGESDDYETVSLFWFADEKILTDCTDIIDPQEIVDIIGVDIPTDFDEQGLMYIRNENHLTEYEVINELTAFEDFVSMHPNLQEE